MPSNPKCQACDLHRSSVNVCVWGRGPQPNDVMIIGEAPGEAEGRTGKPFMGKSGKLLERLLAEQRIEDAYITNVVKCRPPSNRKPEPEEVKACSSYLAEEFSTVRPKFVLLLGASAMKATIRKTKITEMNGQIVDKDGITYVCAFHPAYILRDPSKEGALRSAFARFAQVRSGKFDRNHHLSWTKISSNDQLNRFLEEFEAAEEVTFDIETTGLEWWVDDFKINSIQFKLFPGGLWVLPLALGSLTFDDRQSLLQHLCGLAEGKVVKGQNAKFDNNCLFHVFECRFLLTDDTMLLNHVLDENAPHGLKEMAREHLGVPDYDLSTNEKKGLGDIEKLFEYGARDVEYTHRLHKEIFIPRLDDELSWVYRRLTMPAARAFEKIESNGFFIDLDRYAKTEEQEHQIVDRCLTELNRAAKTTTTNWNSPDQVADILYRKLKLKPRLLTEKGKPSTSEAAIIDLDHPVVEALKKYREHQKFLSTYIDGWKPMMVGPHLFIGFKLHGTVTGRYSSRLHSVPRDGTIRNLFTAPRGWVHVAADYSQVELRIVAHRSKDTQLRLAFQTGQDVHLRTAVRVLRVDPSEVDKETRKKAKAVNFGFVYGMGAPKFVEYSKVNYGLDLSPEEGEDYREEYFSMYSALPAWHEKQRRLVRQDGFVKNMIGRRRRLPGVFSPEASVRNEAERQAINAPVQGDAGDLKAMALVEMVEEFDWSEFRVVGEHHDAILMWVKRDCLYDYLPRIKKVMEHPKRLDELGIEFSVPIEVEIEIGPWSAGKVWKPS